jgi:hypothetical protein
MDHSCPGSISNQRERRQEWGGPLEMGSDAGREFTGSLRYSASTVWTLISTRLSQLSRNSVNPMMNNRTSEHWLVN